MQETIRDTGSVPGLGRSGGGGHGNPLQNSCLENPMDRGAWWAMVDRVAKSWARLKWLSLRACTYFILHLFPENFEEALHLYKLQFVKFWKARFTFFAQCLGSPQAGLESLCEKRSPSWLTSARLWLSLLPLAVWLWTFHSGISGSVYYTVTACIWSFLSI